ncbi:phosphoribosyl 1,2-cyclic phosphate phosphodiesterase [Treponema bryantii]|uniref:Phosphoribosyl 1,2-cyclic phosphate phosphodiesterase n=1 Tax=Treponema bryantii TaxID=163 RepID=A0A1H9CF73_9SPIR|nr:MBL fold metallo-hydrolase [Treponema bryantii]SEP99812.1 phosphoribosyl 1,2-cyclic phosphate phosphodiesterase [Treponema bryantii]
MKLTFLGTGTSHGVPVIACDCAVCKSSDSKDKRTRSSAYIQIDSKDNSHKYILIDVGPDFRTQALRENIRQIDAVLLTHSHADHLHGIDDLRNFSCIMSNKPDNPQNKKYDRPPIPFYTNEGTASDIKHRFNYLFSEKAFGGGHAKISLNPVAKTFTFDTIKITPVPMMHGPLETAGWLLTENTPEGPRSIAYLTDCNYISDESIELIHKECGLENGGRLVHLVIDGLRIKEHSTHFSFLQALEVSEKIGGDHIWFTHLTHNSSHIQTTAYIEEHRAEFPGLATALSILPAYDGLSISTVAE